MCSNIFPQSCVTALVDGISASVYLKADHSIPPTYMTKDVEQGKKPTTGNPSGDELGSTKLWTVYISEAEKYDKALVESWRSDMGGLLIFAGLFSGSLTAFLVESYKNLTPDPGDSTVLLLKEISFQMDAYAKGNYSTLPPPATFSPPVSAILCNALWFISLTLSLTCALIATLVEQWARDFLHRADTRSVPIDRARMFSFLYYGLKRFQMHAVVEVIPLLLHASLILFFAGLVAFLVPVNVAITILGAALLSVVVIVYAILTILPLVYFDCPYRTPLSGALWRIFHAFPYGLFPLSKSGPALRESDTGNIISAISRHATEPSDQRSDRDRKALIWTVKSLTDDTQLEPLVESIPHVLWGPSGKRQTYEEHINALVHDSEAQLLSRISDMLRRCESGLLTPASKTRRQIICYKALWAISSINNEKCGSQKPTLLFELPLIPSGSGGDSEVKHYMLSALALARWNAFCSIDARLRSVLARLRQCLDVTAGRRSNTSFVTDLLRNISEHPIFGFHPFPFRPACADYIRELEKDNASDLPSNQNLLQRLVESLATLCTDIPHIILFDYLYESTKIGTAPFQFEHTREAIILEESRLSPRALLFLERIFNAIISNNMHALRTTPGFHWFDRVMGIFLSLWRPQLTGNVSMPHGLIKYLNGRVADGAVLHVVWQFGPDALWSCITSALTDGRLSDGTDGLEISVHDLLVALWRLYSLPARIMLSLPTCESVLEAAMNLPSSPALPSVIALIKANIVDVLRARDDASSLEPIHPILAGQTAHELPMDESKLVDIPNQTLQRVLRARTMEARLNIGSEFLEACSSPEAPYNAVKTLSIIKPIVPSVSIHKAHQRRFTKSIASIFRGLTASARGDSEILEAAINLDVFDVYAPTSGRKRLPATSGSSQPLPWLDDAHARGRLKDFLVDYEETLISSSRSPAIVSRVKAILSGLETFHPDHGRPSRPGEGSTAQRGLKS